jgi:hypothetical protein
MKSDFMSNVDILLNTVQVNSYAKLNIQSLQN